MIAPLFTIRPLDWEPPDLAEIDAILLTSANAPRFAGPSSGAFLDLPCYAVGGATAAAARESGFANVRTGHSDGVALLEMAAADGMRRALHLRGRDHIPLDHPGVRLVGRNVYVAEPASALPAEALEAIADGAVTLLHSPRAATIFTLLLDAAGLDRAGIRIAAITAAALAAAGTVWARAESASEPNDEALLEQAIKLCKT